MNKSIYSILILLTFLFIRCSNETPEYDIGGNFTNQSSKVAYIDTMSVNISTVLIDSFVTSTYNKVFVGKQNDEVLGHLESTSYITFGLGNSLPTFSVKDSVRFDSLVLYMRFNGEYMGDTMMLKTINAYRLTQTVEPNTENGNSYYYNTTNFDMEAEPLGSISMVPKPFGQPEYFIHLPDSLGKNLLDSIRNEKKATNVSSTTDFLEYFKGIALKPGNEDNSASLGFYGKSTNSSTSSTEHAEEIQLRLYYTLLNRPDGLENPSDKNSFYAFVPNDEKQIFTSYKADRTGTLFENTQGNGTKISSIETDNKAVLQSGSGLAIKVEIPNIDNLQYLNKENGENILLIDATLIMRPSIGFYNKYIPLPSKLYLYWTDSKNRIKDPLYLYQTTDIASATLVRDDELNENTYYSISILDFLNKEIEDKSSSDNALLILLPLSNYSSSFQRLILDNQMIYNNSFEIQLHYYIY